jgi:cell wall-associated NlpC family hydrolase
MSRFPTITAVLAGALLAFLPLHTAEAAAKKSSKKKATPSKTADAAAAEKKPPLDLPLPEKPTPPGDGAGSAETKVAEKPAPDTKPAEKSGTETAATREYGPNATVELDDITEFAAQPPRIQQLIRDAINLTRMNLTYTPESADPENGGMDCSGTIYYLLKAHGFNDVANSASEQYLWARKSGAFYPVLSKAADSVEFNELLPGDLMFWTGTYKTERDVPVSHVMLYLGREKGTNQRIMVGASDGRSYKGVQRWGVSVFDFKMPRLDPENPEHSKGTFVGFARIPGLRSPIAPVENATAASGTPTKPKSTTTSTRKKKKSSGKSK